MPRYLATLVRFKHDEKGVTALEYGLIVACVAVAIFSSLSVLDTTVSMTLTNLTGRLSSANAAAK